MTELYYYICVNKGNEVLCDEDGNTITFSSREEAIDYIEEHELDLIYPNTEDICITARYV